jgi:hypothetical protein
MLPGFRFLLAAIVLSLSILVFGLGAAALLRAAHEEFASIPSRRAPPEPVFAQQNEAPTLALLRVEPPVAEKAPDTMAAVAVPEAVTPSEQARDATPAAPEKLTALKPDDSVPADAVKPEAVKPEALAAEALAAEALAAEAIPATPPVAAQTEAPASVEETKLAAIAETPPLANDAVRAQATETPALEAPSLEASAAATKIATLGGPAVTIDQPAPAKLTDAKPHRSEVTKRARAERKREQRSARRARQAASQQQSADPFGQPTIVRTR